VFATLDGNRVDWNGEKGKETEPSQLAGVLAEGGLVQVLPNGKLLAWPQTPEADDLGSLNEIAVVYLWRDQGESFVVEHAFKTVRNPNGYPSAVAPPTFFLLADALNYYDTRLARYSTCHILRRAWHDERRLVLVNKPEKIMRNSLAQHLLGTLRDHAEVREEQNVSETQPIDIKVTWSLAEHISLIEIKWVGRSVDGDGEELSTEYWSPSRPREGAKQLADYLEENKQRAPEHDTEGYLVVYDARREGLTELPPKITDDQARAYAKDAIVYEPDFETLRDDFRKPRRFWLEPKLLAA
jgi:hypothetical protein